MKSLLMSGILWYPMGLLTPFCDNETQDGGIHNSMVVSLEVLECINCRKGNTVLIVEVLSNRRRSPFEFEIAIKNTHSQFSQIILYIMSTDQLNSKTTSRIKVNRPKLKPISTDEPSNDNARHYGGLHYGGLLGFGDILTPGEVMTSTSPSKVVDVYDGTCKLKQRQSDITIDNNGMMATDLTPNPPSTSWWSLFTCCRPPRSTAVEYSDINTNEVYSSSNEDIPMDNILSPHSVNDKGTPLIKSPNTRLAEKDTVINGLRKQLLVEEETTELSYEEIDALQKELQHVKSELENTIAIKNDISNERDRLLADNESLHKQISIDKERITSLESRLRQSKEDVISKLSEVNSLKKEIETIQTSLVETTSQRDDLTTKEEAMRKEISVILNKMKWMQHDVEVLQSEVKEVNADKSNLQKVNKAKEAEIDELMTEKSYLQCKITEKDTEIDKLRKELGTSKEETRKLSDNLDKHDEGKKKANESIVLLSTQNKEMAQQIEKFKAEREWNYETTSSLRIELNDAKEKIKSLEIELFNHRRILLPKETENENLEKELRNVQKKLKEAQAQKQRNKT